MHRSASSEGHANIGITLDTYSYVLPGLQEAAAEKFEEVVEAGSGLNPDDSVSKMLASGVGVTNEPGGIRTRDALIKSQKVEPWSLSRFTTFDS